MTARQQADQERLLVGTVPVRFMYNFISIFERASRPTAGIVAQHDGETRMIVLLELPGKANRRSDFTRQL